MVDQPHAPMIDKESNANRNANLKSLLDRFLELCDLSLKSFDPTQESLFCAVLLSAQQTSSSRSFQVAATRGLSQAFQDVELSDAHSLIGRTIDSNKGNVSKDLHTDPDLGKFAELRKFNSAYCVPLQNHKDKLGVLLFGAQDEDYFAKPRQDLLNLIGEQVSHSIKNFYNYQDIEFQMQLHKELRRKTARELHDGLTQVVAALAMRANFARRMMEVDPEATEQELIKVEELARVTTKEIRQMIFSLKPSEIDSLGLKTAVESMAGKFGDLFSLEVAIHFNRDLESMIPINRQRVIYSLIEESINIIRKKGGTKQVEVRLSNIENEFLLLEIEEQVQRESIEEKDQMNGEYESMLVTASLIKATVQVDTNQENGLLIKFYIPHSDLV